MIDTVQLDAYLAYLDEEVQESVKREPGVLSLYAMSKEDALHKITVFEIYANQAAYESHIASPHFQKYKQGTLSMVKSLKLNRMNPVSIAVK